MPASRFSLFLFSKNDFLVAALVALITTLMIPLRRELLLANILVVYLFLVFLTALKMERRSSILASIFSLIAFFYFFLPPHSSFAIIDLQYLLTLFFMLFIALITSHLTSGLRTQVVLAENRERRIRSLYELASSLTGIVTSEQLYPSCRHFIRENFDEECILLLPDANESLKPVVPPGDRIDISLARKLFQCPPGPWTDLFSRHDAGHLYLPLPGSEKNQGILIMGPPPSTNPLSAEQESLLKTCLSFVGLVLERLDYAARERETQIRIESERLRNALLASLSHDIRTPVAAMAGMADAMQLSFPPLGVHHQSMLDGMRHQIALILSDVDKLLDMARLHRDIVTLNKEWQVLEEVVGAALKTSMNVLTGYDVQVTMALNIPLIELDGMMMERVFCNLLENATRHTPCGSRIDIDAFVAGKKVIVHVSDNGPGLPTGQEEAIFAKFVHAKTTTGSSGVGLGLSIVRAIIMAHGGTIRAHNLPSGGARFEITLPIGEPPAVTLDTEELQ
ncbi:MAG: DUF4118 domain-containing protein [Magnetococcales bacterium]|nr:DUF4118 domain-containing protein [Magnetococcales bacterium]